MFTVETALEDFEAHLAGWLPSHDGQFVVMVESKPPTFHGSYEEALTWAYEKVGLQQFFVKQISAQPEVAHFSRDLGVCAA
jgi:hypothetical protein